MTEPKYEDKMDDNDAICPYCGWSYQVEGEDYDPDSRAIECDECGMKFWLNEEFDVTHWSRPDCELNGQEHDYELVNLKNGKSAFFCKVCDDCSSTDTGELKAEIERAKGAGDGKL